MGARELYLGGTLASIALSISLFASGKRDAAIFVGLWAPTILQLGQNLVETD